MEYLTKLTLTTRLESSQQVQIFIPPREKIEALMNGEDSVHVTVKWRGRSLTAKRHDLMRSIASAEAVTVDGK